MVTTCYWLKYNNNNNNNNDNNNNDNNSIYIVPLEELQIPLKSLTYCTL